MAKNTFSDVHFALFSTQRQRKKAAEAPGISNSETGTSSDSSSDGSLSSDLEDLAEDDEEDDDEDEDDDLSDSEKQIKKKAKVNMNAQHQWRAVHLARRPAVGTCITNYITEIINLYKDALQ